MRVVCHCLCFRRRRVVATQARHSACTGCVSVAAVMCGAPLSSCAAALTLVPTLLCVSRSRTMASRLEARIQADVDRVRDAFSAGISRDISWRKRQIQGLIKLVRAAA